MLEGDFCCSARSVNDVSYVTRFNHERSSTATFPGGSCSDRPCIVNDVSAVSAKFFQILESFFVAGAVFGDVGG